MQTANLWQILHSGMFRRCINGGISGSISCFVVLLHWVGAYARAGRCCRVRDTFRAELPFLRRDGSAAQGRGRGPLRTVPPSSAACPASAHTGGRAEVGATCPEEHRRANIAQIIQGAGWRRGSYRPSDSGGGPRWTAACVVALGLRPRRRGGETCEEAEEREGNHAALGWSHRQRTRRRRHSASASASPFWEQLLVVRSLRRAQDIDQEVAEGGPKSGYVALPYSDRPTEAHASCASMGQRTEVRSRRGRSLASSDAPPGQPQWGPGGPWDLETPRCRLYRCSFVCMPGRACASARILMSVGAICRGWRDGAGSGSTDAFQPLSSSGVQNLRAGVTEGPALA